MKQLYKAQISLLSRYRPLGCLTFRYLCLLSRFVMAFSPSPYTRPSLRFVLLLSSASCLIVDKFDAQYDSVQRAQIKEVKRLRSGSVIHRQLWWPFFFFLYPLQPAGARGNRALLLCSASPAPKIWPWRETENYVSHHTWDNLIKRQRCERI